ncbi:MAG: hypothetical protein PVG65_00450 [Candidatus Thorarchaeota archaeon]|jgi:hypothetical protein
MKNVFEILYTPKSHKKTKGAFGGIKNRFLGIYKTLKVIPRSKRTKKNCNKEGIIND